MLHYIVHYMYCIAQMLLDLIEDYVRLRGYQYERLDGSVTGEARQARATATARTAPQRTVTYPLIPACAPR